MLKKSKKLIIIIGIDVVILMVLILYFGIIRPYYHPPLKIHGVFIETTKDISDFHFTDNHGKRFTKENLLGHWTLMFFGFTNCPLICPTTMGVLNHTYNILNQTLPKNLLPQVVFISVDPKHDTTDKLNQYINSFNTHFIGARADSEETTALEKQLSITISESNGVINHSADILLINRNAQVQAYFYYPHHAEQMAHDYQLILKNGY